MPKSLDQELEDNSISPERRLKLTDAKRMLEAAQEFLLENDIGDHRCGSPKIGTLTWTASSS
jgi:hypothetical protein